MKSIAYYRRLIESYFGSGSTNLSFWHEQSEVNPKAFEEDSLAYYMKFAGKAEYQGPFDSDRIPRLDYRGHIGEQYNPIAVSQYALGCLNKHLEQNIQDYRDLFVRCSDWLVNRLERNTKGCPVWHHAFDWDYYEQLKSPWYSGLAQGQGISVLVRCAKLTGKQEYLDVAERALESMLLTVEQGGVIAIDDRGDRWIEEYITSKPTHILNGFIWALWGAYDLVKFAPGSHCVPMAQELWGKGCLTIQKNLNRYDCGYWSLYDLAPLKSRNVASAFYHRLHQVQLDVMYRLTGQSIFAEYRDKWAAYEQSKPYRRKALLGKILFKLRYY